MNLQPSVLNVDLGVFSINGSATPGTSSASQKRIFPFLAIQFQVFSTVGSPVLNFDISTDEVNWRQCTFAESANTANVNSVTAPPTGYIGIVTIRPVFWRLRVVGAGTSIVVKVTGILS